MIRLPPFGSACAVNVEDRQRGHQARHVARLLQERERERERENSLGNTPYQDADMGGVRGGMSFGSTGDEATGLRVHCIHVV
jgi:hypothetical protein